MAIFDKRSTRTITGSLSRSRSTQGGWRKLEVLLLVAFGVVVTGACLSLLQIMVVGTESKVSIEDPNRPQPARTVRGTRELPQYESNKRKVVEHPKETLVLTVKDVGMIEIVLRPDWSTESVEYIHKMVQEGVCSPCNLYRAEKPGILQGIMKSKDVPIATVKGSCPPGFETVANSCPEWDASCGCHGPVMQRGYVGWAAGQTGPDFFMGLYPRPATWWGTQHTVWGEIQDKESLRLIDEKIFTLPIHDRGGMRMLDHPLHFDMSFR